MTNLLTHENLELLVAVLVSVITSSSYWQWIAKRDEKKSVQITLLVGLAHDRIVYLGMKYIHRGWISQDEYENLREYLYKPYLVLGGNGTAKRVMDEVDKLPIRQNNYDIEKGETQK